MSESSIRSYKSEDYQNLKALYEDSGWFDPETDAEQRLQEKIQRDPRSLLVAEDIQKIIVGTLSLIEDRRIALFFRLVTKDTPEAPQIRSELILEGEKILKEKGYKEAHIIAPEEDIECQKEYENDGFTKGNSYRWMWKKLI